MTHHLTALLAALLVTASASAADEPPRLSALFLGDQGHHRPADRAAQIIPVLANRGIDVTYTEDVGLLNAASLGQYDALIVYANIERIAPEQEQALLDYVAGGGGFVPIHCASYCFLNSPRYIALVGAQFQRHGTGEFETQVADPEHPVMQGLRPFRTWDETYVHHLHNMNDRRVLQTRIEGDGEEPWTWVRTHGKGRVFYTAYGHDERTWGEPGFHDLIERGIRWAANKGGVFDSGERAIAGLKPFEYEKAELPNYVPSSRWGTQGEPLTQMQLPLPAEESLKHLVVPRGFHVELFAAEPDITKPIAITWDHRGRLWIAETVDYPNELQPEGQGHDRIKICEDTDGDGRADKFTVFAENLSIPTSLCFARGGVIVHEAPETVLLRDTNGDDKADERIVLLSGWNTNDTHAGPSNMVYGFDNWIYGMVGYAGFRGRVGGERVQFQTGFYRFRPDGSDIEFLRNTNNNSWGVGFSEDGLLFGSTANGCPSVYLPIPNRYYESVRGWTSTVLENIAPNNDFHPITDNVRQVDHHGGFTAAAGHALYTARAWPSHYWNSTAFVTEPTGHLVATFSLVRRGSDVVSYNSWNQLASDDEWTSPIMAEVGPDGQLWVIDWYNYIVQHNPTPRGYETGKGNAYETDLRDKRHGRIYRVVADDSPKPDTISLDPDDAEQLITALNSDNLFWRRTAQRLLVERGETDVVPKLIELVQDQSTDAIGLNPGAIHALWTLAGLGAVDADETDATAAVVGALGHPSAAVRRHTLHVLPRSEESITAILAAKSLSDPDAHVRLAAFLALADMPTSASAAEAIAEALTNLANTEDRWIRDAATSAAARHALPFLKALAATRLPDASPIPPEIVTRVAEHYARGGPAETIGELVATLSDAPSADVEAVLAGLADGWPRDRKATLDDNAEKALAALMAKVSPVARGRLITLAGRWGTEGLEKYAAEIAAGFLAVAANEEAEDAARAAAAVQLIDFRKTDAAAAGQLLDLLNPRTSPELAVGLINAVARSEAPEVGAALVEHIDAVTPSARPAVLRALLSRGEWTAALMDAIDGGAIPLSELTLDQKQALAGHPDAKIAERAKELLARGGGLPDPDRQKVIDSLGETVLTGGDPVKGKAVFKEQCGKCHTHSGEGTKIGPDLTGMAAHPRHELLIHILDPSRSVEGNFRQYTVLTVDGLVINGLLASETKTAIELIDSEAKRHQILREDIEELVATRKSVMPEGFEKQVPVASLTDLLAFLTQRGKYLPLDLRKVATIVSTQGMFYDKDAEAERLIFSDWSPKTVDGVPFQLVDPQDGRVPNVVLLYGPLGEFPPQMPKSVGLPCNTPARAIHFLSGVSGWGFPYSEEGSVTMTVRLHYADGTTEDHDLKNGVHFADYIRVVDVPESKLAFKLRNQQVRYFAVRPEKPESIERIELIKGPDRTAPVVMAVTVETDQ